MSTNAMTRARPQAAPQRLPVRAPREPDSALGFYLFLLVNIVLFLRPADILEELRDVEIYLYPILACMLFSFPVLLVRLDPSTLDRRPVDGCVLLLLPFIVLSHVLGGRPADAWESGFAYFKLQVYYFLLVSLVTDGRRLRLFLVTLVVCATCMTVLSILAFYKFIVLPRPLFMSGKFMAIDETRMYGPGLFHDPNDVCVVISTSMLLLFALMSDPALRSFRPLALVPLGILGWGFYLTGSRGGFLALAAGVGLMIRLKYGWSRALLLGVPAILAALVLIGGRQATADDKAETAQERMGLWDDGLLMLRGNPVFGVGHDRFALNSTHVAHNSYIQYFAELGFVGGMLFLGAFAVAVYGLYRLSFKEPGPGGRLIDRRFDDPGMAALYPFVTGATLAYAVGMLTLTLNMVPTTFTYLGLASVYAVSAKTTPETKPIRFDVTLMVKFAILGVCYLLGILLFIRLTMR